MRLTAAVGLIIAICVCCATSSTAASPTGKRGCNGLLAFASNRAEDLNPQIYRITLDGRRRDVGGSLEGDTNPQPSPDGRELAFWSNRPGGGLFVSDADGSHPRRMRLPANWQATTGVVVWSPDSRRLALPYDPPDGSGSVVGVFDANSGAEALLGPGESPAWSPDGSRIAVATVPPPGTPTGGNDNLTVFVERSDGSGRVFIAPGSSAVWSPDGTHLIVDWRLVVPVGGGAGVSLGRFTGRVWTPDSSRILANLTTTTGTDLWSIAADGSDPQPIAQNAYGAVLSPDGQRLVFDRSGEIVVTDLAGQVLHDLGRWDAGPIDLHMQFAPRWSPDGTKILYWSGGKVMVADAGSGEVRALTGGSGEQIGQPVWAADGFAVYATITDTAGNTDIYVSRPDGSHVRPVFTDPVPEGGPVWSPDGKQLAFVRYGSPPSLIVTDPAGHGRTLLRDGALGRLINPPLSPDGSELPGGPTWSPDGKTIAVGSNSGILLINARTGATRTWSHSGTAYLSPAWSRDGAIASTDGVEGGSITVVDTHHTWKTPVGDFTDPDYGDVAGLAENLAWSPDGSKLAFLRSGIESGTGYLARQVDSIRILDRRTHKTRSVPTNSSSFGWSPDGRYFIQGGFDALITRTDGRRVGTLKNLRALHPSWQPLCQHRAALSR